MTLYEILGIKPDALPSNIKHAYRKLARVWHPDTGGDAERFRAIQRAFDILSDPEKRRHYDETGKADEAENRQRDIEGGVCDVINQVIAEHGENVDLIEYGKNKLFKSVETFARNMNAAQDNAALFRRIKARIRFKDHPSRRDVIGEMMEAKIAGFEAEAARQKINSEMARECLEYLSSFEDAKAASGLPMREFAGARR